jgi:RimJ/RimL family protein N-acetyltransferase
VSEAEASVVLGPLLASDGPKLFGWLNEPANARANGPYRPWDQAKFEAWFRSAGGDPARVLFAIRDRADQRLLGYLQFTNIQPASRTAEIGILIGEEQDRGRGAGEAALRIALEYGWRDLNLQRVTLYIFGANPRAVRAYEKVGFEVEGVLRRGAFVGGAYVDVTVMGVLAERP